MDITVAIFKLGIVLLVGYCGGKFAQKLKLPNVSGYLLMGLFLGPSLSLLLPSNLVLIPKGEMKSFSIIKEIALSFIAFSIGSEFKLENIKRNGKSIGIITFFEVIGAVIFVFLIIFLLPKPHLLTEASKDNSYKGFLVSKDNISFTFVLASMAATTAPAATLLVMRQYRAYGPLTKTIIPVTAIDDIFGIVAFGIMYSIAELLISTGKSGTGIPIGYQITKPFIDVIVSVLFGFIVGAFLATFVNKFAIDKYEKQVLALLSVLITFTLSNLISETKGNNYVTISPLLANIGCGTIVSNRVKHDKDVYESLNDFTNPFYILFFTLAGASLDLNILKSSWQILLLALGYIIFRAGGKYAGSFVGASVTKQSGTVKKYLGLGLLPQGGVSLGLIVIVSKNPNIEMEKFGEIITAVMLISVMIYEIFGPIFAKIAITKAGEINGLDRINAYQNSPV